MTPTQPNVRSYDLIGFGDEVPGVLALVAAAREFNRRTGRRLKTLLMFKGSSLEGVGGHLVRGGLAYLDRSNIPLDVRQTLGLPTFGDPAAIYKEFLQRAGVAQIALDPRKADAALRRMLSEAGVDIISRIQIQAVLKEGSKLVGIKLTSGQTYLAKQFIDSTVHAELAQIAGVPKLKGFETFGLPESELPVTLVFETEGLSIQRLKDVELSFLKRFINRNDSEAQRFINIAAGSNAALAEQFRQGLVTPQGQPRTMYVGQDHIDVLSRALSIAYHSFRGKKLALAESGAILDQANIAILPGGRLSWNALLIYTTGSQAEALARGAAKPTAAMLEEMKFIEKWFKSIGATVVRSASELYIRHAGNVTGVVEPLSGARMLEGGVFSNEALGTFGYHLDVRGGITGLGARAAEKGIASISFHTPPLFNIGIRHALVRSVPNLAVVSPASGFDGYACAAGRIVEFNVAVGQGVGIAASLAIISNRNLAEITNREVRQVLEQTGQLSRIYGRSYMTEASRLQAFETSLIA
ncbi:FAD-dependent oxidoreductase [Kovacikia minuta CCNUW1]|uniref:FAD-dependent oxidoreductase n=1 Tax=Kovacikia minuta TaxID=2931930 RepID=UPI001CC9724D|nr:FAD-dependent oxidoreductase [Kovacikia minuta]UBF28494.1 FAD-dependent oxidoreductase [Kovacikia minuta CCNUW1]